MTVNLMEPVRSQAHVNTVFVLGGGGNLGAVQVGMLQALLRSGIKPDGVVGTSIGALNGAFLAGHANLSGVNELSALWDSLRRRDVFPVRVRGLLGGLFGHQQSLFGSAGLRGLLLQAHLGFERVEEAPIPLRIVATDFYTGAAVILDRGEVVRSLLASSAIPGLYPPVEIDGRTLVDGGVAANTPIAQAESLDPQVVYVLPTLPVHPSQPPTNALIMMQRVMELATFPTEHRRLTEVAARREVRVLPVPEIAANLSMFDFRVTRRLMEEAYLLTAAWLEHNGPRMPEELEFPGQQVLGPTRFSAIRARWDHGHLGGRANGWWITGRWPRANEAQGTMPRIDKETEVQERPSPVEVPAGLPTHSPHSVPATAGLPISRFKPDASPTPTPITQAELEPEAIGA